MNKKGTFATLVIAVAVVGVILLSVEKLRDTGVAPREIIEHAPAGRDVKAVARKEVEHAKDGPGRERIVVAPAEKATHMRRTVYYGTDRQRAPASVVIASSVDLLWVALVVAWSSAGLLLVLAWQTIPKGRWAGAGLTLASIGIAVAPLFWLRPARHNPAAASVYGDERSELQYGACVVSIPLSHGLGGLEEPAFIHFEFREDPAKHIVLQRVEIMGKDEFAKDLHAALPGKTSREAFVLIHGYNVTFEDAARRTAQVAHDLGFTGIAAFYSWPSRGFTPAYTWDEESAKDTVPHLQTFLETLARDAELNTIHLIAHSMGNRCLTEAIQKGVDLGTCRVGECILAAPDIDAVRFRRDVAPAVIPRVGRLTLYASNKDRALMWSQKVHRYPRAGDAGQGIVVLDGMESVDASFLETDSLGHSYYGDSPHMIKDLKQLIQQRLPAAKRVWMHPISVTPRLSYWEFRPAPGLNPIPPP